MSGLIRRLPRLRPHEALRRANHATLGPRWWNAFGTGLRIIAGADCDRVEKRKKNREKFDPWLFGKKENCLAFQMLPLADEGGWFTPLS